MSEEKRRSGAGSTTGVVSPATMKDVARVLGVSTATVSRALSGEAGVSDELRDKVLDAARSLNFQPNRIARSLRVRQAKAVGVMIPDIENPFFTGVLRGIEDVLLGAGYALLLANLAEDPTREETQLSALRAEGVAGIIFAPTIAQTADYARQQAAGLSMVAVSRAPRDLAVDLVTVDNERGACEAVSRLLSLGHTRIGFIAGPEGVSSTVERMKGYAAAHRKAGLRPLNSLLVHGDFRQSGGYQGTHKLLDVSPAPTALFSGNNLSTLGALQALHERGLRIPDDIALIGFDDLPWALSFQPPLTVVEQPTFEIGATAANLLLQRIRDPGRPLERIVLKTKLIVRASCG